MTDIIHELFLKGRDVVAVAGTHGKSTTTGLLAHILTVAGKDPSFLVGGELKNYQANYRLGNGDFFIIEGDEYDSAFFEKWPKVIAYRPKYLVLTSLEFDHGDIYRDLHELEKWFTYLIRLIPGKNTIISSGKYETLRSILEEGFSPVRYTGDDIRYSSHEGLLAIELNKGRVECRPHLKGDFNHENIALAAAMAENLGIELQSIQEGIETYRGIKRRQEVLLEEKSLVVIEDFAHHPTAIKAVTESLSQEYPRWKIWQLYEPASATGARNIFQADLPDSFLPHQPVLLYKSPRLSRLSLENRLDLLQVKKDLEARECRVAICSSGEDIVKQLAKGFDSGEKNIIIILSNGSFDGAAEKIVAWVKNEIIS
jgi:UDP-N-acetylmuramate: L-alanyl-gamma-D-glutamyl-meso-diaminopimelate ligase